MMFRAFLYLVLFIWSSQSVAFQDVISCPAFRSVLQDLKLASCSFQVKKCLIDYFESGYSYCSTCILVGEDLKDESNCDCVQCLVRALKDYCFPKYCTAVSETLLMDSLRVTDAKGELLETTPPLLNLTKLTYSFDESNNNRRNLLYFEKVFLVNSLFQRVNFSSSKASAASTEDVECETEKNTVLNNSKNETHP